MRLTLRTKLAHYPIIIQPGSIEQFRFPDNAIVVTNQQLNRSYPKVLASYRRIIIPATEADKRLTTVEWLAEQLVQLRADRSTSLIAWGGGIVGDIVGFTAAIYKRGLPYYHVPTTLLAMVDSSIGGKTGVDLAAGKNLIGCVYQPQAVIIDPRFLLTLSSDQFHYGMAEVIKHGILEPTLFTWLEKNVSAIHHRSLTTLQQLIKRNVEVKRAVVEVDETELGPRMLLNLGHSFGHAFEKLSQYRLAHGAAVAIGLAYASAYAHMPERDRVLSLLQQFDLPVTLPRLYSPKAIVQAMLTDKKNRQQSITLVLPRRLGEVRIDPTITPAQVLRFVQDYQG